MAELSLNSSLKVSDDVVFRDLDGEGVILNLASGVYFGLDETGTRMWRLIEQHGHLAAVLAALCDEFDAACERAAFVTPVPGGVGPLTTTLLFKNLTNLIQSHGHKK